MGLSVIGAGFGRTGTMSLKLALEQLGFGPCHHMEEIFANPLHVVRWRAAIAGEKVDWNAVYDGYNATADWPGVSFTQELAAYYPDAKIILTLRPVESWWESYSRTILLNMQNLPEDTPAPIRDIIEMATEVVGKKSFGSTIDDELAAKIAYSDHVEKITGLYGADRLLQFNVKDGWKPLCDFLEKPVPDGEFPHSNRSAQFFDNFSTDG